MKGIQVPQAGKFRHVIMIQLHLIIIMALVNGVMTLTLCRMTKERCIFANFPRIHEPEVIITEQMQADPFFNFMHILKIPKTLTALTKIVPHPHFQLPIPPAVVVARTIAIFR